MRTALLNISNNYEGIFGERLDDDRLEEIDDLLAGCATLDDVEDLADTEDAIISGGEYEAIRQEVDGQTNPWNIS